MRKLQRPPTARLYLIIVRTLNGRYWTGGTYGVHAHAWHTALTRAFLAHKRTLPRGARIAGVQINAGAPTPAAKARKP